MGDASGHIAKAKHNQDFLDFIRKFDLGLSPTFPDWMVTVIFYIAVHLVDSNLANIAPPPLNHPRTHADRNTAVAMYLSHISSYYFFLKNKSEYSRYFAYSEQKIKQPLIKKCLAYLSKL